MDQPSGRDHAKPDERCSCGRPAVMVYITEKFGRVPYCGVPEGAHR